MSNSIIRFGNYYNTSTMSVPLGDKLLHPMKKIHSANEDFQKIDIRYIHNGYVKFERDVPFTSLGRYTDYDTEVVFVQAPLDPSIFTEEEVKKLKETFDEIKEEIKDLEIVSGEEIKVDEIKIIDVDVDDIEKIEEVNEVLDGEILLDTINVNDPDDKLDELIEVPVVETTESVSEKPKRKKSKKVDKPTEE